MEQISNKFKSQIKLQKMTSLKTIGNVTTSASNFSGAVTLNESVLAYETLKTVLGDDFYPENAVAEWTDIMVDEDGYFAVFGEDSLTADTQVKFIEVEPTNDLVKKYEYFSNI
jgi:hypothetical protein